MTTADGTIEREIQKVLAGSPKPRLLLHTCCGPCLCGAMSRIKDFFDITIFFYNPNIMPKSEFNMRLCALKTVVEYFGNVKLIVPEQSEDEYTSLVRGLENLPEGGQRCEKCFALRLEKTALYMREHADDYDYFATTLTVSPHKNAALINEIGAETAARTGTAYLASDLKKHDGSLMSTRLSKELGIYRQNYCGCAF